MLSEHYLKSNKKLIKRSKVSIFLFNTIDSIHLTEARDDIKQQKWKSIVKAKGE